MRLAVAALLLTGVSACAGAPGIIAAPSPWTVTATHPLVVAGQSNAVNVAPFLRAVYPQPVLSDSTQNGRPISSWSPTEQPPELWPLLAGALHQRVQAVVWWQGESDRDNPHYLDDLRALAVRIRSENGNPALLIVVVRVLDLPLNIGVRTAQQAFVAGDLDAVLVSSDGPGFQNGTSDHLTDAGYGTVAQRIVATLR
jgi:hypothetical protein